MNTLSQPLQSPPAATQDPNVLNGLILSTAFVEAFKSEFLRRPIESPLRWPAIDAVHEVVAAQLGMFVEVLRRMQRNENPPPPSGDPLRDRIVQFVVNQRWPSREGPPLPASWGTNADQWESGRLTEIWLICRELLNAAHRHGGGGQPATIPPH